mgnify:CR=1 FL=1
MKKYKKSVPVMDVNNNFVRDNMVHDIDHEIFLMQEKIKNNPKDTLSKRRLAHRQRLLFLEREELLLLKKI